MSKIRTWTDRTGSFKVEAQFLGLSDNKIQLHKLNGVKISVPLSKISEEDEQYIKKLTGRNLSPPPPKPPPDSEKPKPKRIEFDWFTFFLESGVDYNVCQRYSAAFERDQMDESVLPDINTETLRTLGVREGDILRIMKRLDDKFGRTSSRKKIVRFGGEEVVEDDEKDDLSDVIKITRPAERQESLFSSGPGGALRNNTTRRGRPTAGKSAPGEVDGTLLSNPVEKEGAEVERHGVRPLRVPPSRLANFREQPQKSSGEGFEDDAWAVKEKPALQPQRQPQPAPVVQSPTALTGPPAGSAIHELASIGTPNVNQNLSPPLQPQTSPVTIQFNPQPIAPPVVNRPSSVPPTQTAPQFQPLQQHRTGVSSQPHLTGPTPAQASGAPTLDEQLAKLQLYQQQQQLQQATYLSQFQPPQTAFANGYSPQVQPQPIILQPQATAYMPNFLPPGQQASQLGPTRSMSTGLPPPLIPANTLSPPQPPFIATHRTGPANFGPTIQPQFQPTPQPFQLSTLQPQQTGYQPLQPQAQAFNPQPTGLQPQPTGFQPPSFLPPSPLVPQQTAFQAQMLPQKTGSDATFKPVSFGAKPKPLVPTRTGKRADLSAASNSPFARNGLIE
jgi:actin cytoskeleton-regulatory complex protein SLA1